MFEFRGQRMSLIQASTETVEQIDHDILVTLTTPQERLLSPSLSETSNEYYSSHSSASHETDSDSSDWDSLSDQYIDNISVGNGNDPSQSHYHTRTTSLASVYLPRNHKKRNPTLAIESFVPSNITEQERDRNIDTHTPVHNQSKSNTNSDIFFSDSLFYPFPNLQSLLFSQFHPYTANDYRIIENENNENESDTSDNEGIDAHNNEMDWFHRDSVQKFTDLISQLLITASFGIREDEIYLMFSSPTPQSIIRHLRFGVLSHRCNVHIDRFGRRSFYYNYNNASSAHITANPSHFFKHDSLPSELCFDVNDDNLVQFIAETPINDSPVNTAVEDTVVNQRFNDFYLKTLLENDSFETAENDTQTTPTSPINTDWNAIPMAKPLKINSTVLTKKSSNQMPIKLKQRFSNNLSNDHYAIVPKKKRKMTNYHKNAPNIGHGIRDRINIFESKVKNPPKAYTNESVTFKTAFTNTQIIKPKFKRKHSKQKRPPKRALPKKRRPPPSVPKPAISDTVKRKLRPKPKISEKTKQKLKQRKKHRKNALGLREFNAVSIASIIYETNDGNNDNYVIARKIAQTFDKLFGDTDTVVVCSGPHCDPSLSYWLSGHGNYVRKSNVFLSTNHGSFSKTVCIYRACAHTAPKEPILSKKEFESFVRDLCERNKNKSVQWIGDKLDQRFGAGVHFARSTLKRCDYDIFCRFTDYECSFTMASGAYIIAWRR